MMAGRSVRINVSIPEEILDSLNQLALPRNRSRLICESLRHYILQKKNAELEKKLEEGYRACAKESTALARQFEEVDLEGWG
ncbi:hypothetical protein GW860_15570 [bacterium]|nr:hypothetical protein [bacterium]NCP10289.1 hypothetical protein [bacterium]OIP43040.1 MAG: hypothetical protein AUK25_02485 [Desulfobacteraceae bacterium CG2_30_51_40]